MRTRTKSGTTFHSCSKRVFMIDSENWGTWKDLGDEHPPIQRAFITERSEITDEATRPNKSINYVDHYRGRLEFGERLITYYGSGSFYKYQVSAAELWFQTIGPNWTISNYCQSLTESDWDELVDRGMNSLVDQAGLSKVTATMPFIGELHKTVHQLKHPLEFLSKMPNSKSLRKLSLGQALKQIGFGPASDAWLTKKYGWDPLMQDLLAFGKSFSTATKDYRKYVQAKESGRVFRSEVSLERSHPGPNKGPDTGWWWESVDKQTGRFIVTGRLNPRQQTLSTMNFMSERFGLTAENLITTAWELVPYSFVVDWFIPVGAFLAKVTASPCAFELLSTQFDLRSDSTVNFMYRWNGPMASGYNSEAGDGRACIARVKGKWYHREVKPLSGNYGSDWTFSTNKVVTALALIGQRLQLPI